MIKLVFLILEKSFECSYNNAFKAMKQTSDLMSPQWVPPKEWRHFVHHSAVASVSPMDSVGFVN